eukprot:GILK01026323.1.p1 GENE.GILK01026323.1~~GILK01026323.1.p1  ORF type:complete len:104 (-),score=3.16 GILK01026323.1:7-318(-)
MPFLLLCCSCRMPGNIAGQRKVSETRKTARETYGPVIVICSYCGARGDEGLIRSDSYVPVVIERSPVVIVRKVEWHLAQYNTQFNFRPVKIVSCPPVETSVVT